MLSENTLIEDPVRQFEQAFTGRQAMIWTALPGIIQSFNAEALTCEVQPAIQGRRLMEEGNVEIVNLPLLLDCPVVFPHAGGCSLTFPIKAGDECLVVFASRSIDLWWQSGGLQPPAEPRMHDLSDGFVIPGPWSQATKIGSVSTSQVELRTDDRQAYIALNPSSHQITIVTSGSVNQTISGNVSQTVNGSVTESISGTKTVTASSVAFKCPVTMSSTLTVDGTLKGDGINLSTHTHSGVSTGTGNSGAPNKTES